MIKKNTSLLFIFLFCFVISSCAYQYEPLEKEQRTFYYHNISSVVVVPFLDHTQTPGLSERVTSTFTLELGRFSEVGVVHGTSVDAYLKEKGILLTETNLLSVGLELARHFNVETIIIGVITEWQGYFPPVLGLSLDVITVKEQESLITISETYDASFNYIRLQSEQYAGAKEVSDSVFGREVVLRKMDLFIQFVCHDLIRKNL